MGWKQHCRRLAQNQTVAYSLTLSTNTWHCRPLRCRAVCERVEARPATLGLCIVSSPVLIFINPSQKEDLGQMLKESCSDRLLAMSPAMAHNRFLISGCTILERESDIDGLRKQCTPEKWDGVLWTKTRAAIHRATCTTDFLPRHITTVARTGRRIEQLLLTKVSDKDRNVKVDSLFAINIMFV